MHESWTVDARSVLDDACSWHGGVEVYRSVRSISLTPKQFDGWLPSRKGLRRSFPLPRRFDVFPHERCTVFVDYPEAGFDGVFDDGHVWIRRRETDEVAADGPDHRRTFAGLDKYRRWDALDALYFFGYALWHYHTLPFSLVDAEFLRLRSTGGSRPLTVVDVELPEDVPTHGRRQSFHFDWAGRLQRHDYHAEVLGGWARGAHFWRDYHRVEGLAVAMERLVVPRLWGRALPGTFLHATFSGAEVRRGE